MSRGAFRASVEVPRPASAWLLVTVASATLWITEQLDTWVMALQVAAIVGSLARRENPHPWQKNPIVLNVGMLGITAATIAVALRGGPTTIGLAHFAALTQGLQLFDARPRRTEFLLVALALFQVILASNLTDSVFFPPLLIAFVFATVWTLLVHTLRIEANEAGDRRAVDRTLTPGLLRMTVLASGFSVLLALVLFLALPRLRSNVVTGASLGGVIATAGFSDRVALGELGRIRQDDSVVMRIETLGGEAPTLRDRYWRGLAFDRFDGASWRVTPSGRTLIPGSPEGGITLGPRPDEQNLLQQIVREPVEAGVLFGMGDVRGVQGTVRRLERDANGGLYAVGQADERIRYTVATYEPAWSDRALRRDRAAPPERNGGRYLALPDLSPEVAALARRVTRDAETDADRARAIEGHLLAHGRYSDTPPSLDPALGSPIENFLLGDLAAHCEYFASGFVVLARSAGLPARLVNGFAGGRKNRIGGFTEVTRSDAHAWAEVHYARAGWVRYDATPPDLRFRPAAGLSFRERSRELASALELWWFQRVVGFDRSDQIHAVRRAWLAWQGERPNRGRPKLGATNLFDAWKSDRSFPWTEAAWITAATLAAGLLLWRLRGGRPDGLVPAAYAEALRLLARRGLPRDARVTARAFARAVSSALPASGPAFAALTESYLEERFGGHPAPVARARLRELRASLRTRAQASPTSTSFQSSPSSARTRAPASSSDGADIV